MSDWWNPTVIAQREGLREYEDRIAELERQLESARSIAVDRDQRLARIAELLTVDEPDNECGCAECQAYHIAIGDE